MSRSLTSAVQTALADLNVALVMFVQLEFDSGTVYVTSLAYSKDWDGHIWVGLGSLGSIEPITEGENIEAYGINLTLSGIDTALMSAMLSEQYQGRAVTIWMGALDADHQVIADPVVVFKGRMDTPDIEVGATATIRLACEGRLADLDRPRVRRYSHEDQIAVYPADKGLEFVPQMVEKQLYWGQATPAGAA
jgi:hypothetical protein